MPVPKITGPWADWDDTLEGQSVYFSVEEYPDPKKATEELRRLLMEVGEDELTPGRAKKQTVKACGEDCEEYCHTEAHQVEIECWVYKPRRKKERVPSGPPLTMRCPACRLLCLTSRRTRKCYVHGAYSGVEGRIVHCPGSRQPAIDPKGTRLAPAP